MIGIADSGSTKTEWCLLVETGKLECRCFTPGMNPYFQTEKEMAEMIQQSLYPQIADYPIEAFYFMEPAVLSRKRMFV